MMDKTENSLLSAAQKLDLNARCRRCNWAKRSHTKIGVRLVCPDSSGTFSAVPAPAVEVASIDDFGPDIDPKGHGFWVGLAIALPVSIFVGLGLGVIFHRVTIEVIKALGGA